MPTLLHIDSSPVPTSISRELTREFVNAWKIAHPTGRVIYRDLAAAIPSPLDAKRIQAAYTPLAARTPDQAQALAASDELIAELEQADEYVFGIAMHNFSVPAVFKLWIDQVVRNGRTFSYGADGPRGLLRDKKATFLAASGGFYDANSPASSMNFVDPYLKAVFGFIGVTNVEFITAGGVARMGPTAQERENFLQPTLERVRALAA